MRRIAASLRRTAALYRFIALDGAVAATKRAGALSAPRAELAADKKKTERAGRVAQ